MALAKLKTSVFAIFVVLFVSIDKCRCTNILFTFFHDTGSHFQSVFPLMQKLASRGNNVSVLDTVYEQDHSPEIHHFRALLPKHHNDETSKRNFANDIWSRRLSATDLALYFGTCDKELGILMQNHSQKIVQLFDTNWDVIVLDDLFWSFGFAFATLNHRRWHLAPNERKEPHIVAYATAQSGLNSHNSIRATSQFWVGRPTLCPLYPTDSNDVFSPDRFVHRIYALLDIIQEAVAVNIFALHFLMPNIAKFGVPNFSFTEFYSRSQLFLHDSIDRLGLPVATAADIFGVGAHCKTPKDSSALSAKIKHTIYIAFGSHIDWKFAPRKFLDDFVTVFRKLPQYRFIFVCNECKLPGDLTNSVLVLKWAPQLEILAHPNVRAFVTHGGNKSVREGICAGVPLIVMPVYAEQSHTAHLLLKLNIAPVINKFNVDDVRLLKTISQVVSRPETMARAKKVLALFMDRPVPAIEEGAFAVERLVRLPPGGHAKFMRRKGMAFGWTEFAHFDAIIALLILVAITSI
ncbi:hypothetical protein niasHS_010498 [Heterodera schachtii]|uniref:UDP-glucuronosyltransferase n=1 Tax=Heterodera schachtii TaxID=97005 RepID=A0ABD2ITY0_HETSC